MLLAILVITIVLIIFNNNKPTLARFLDAHAHSRIHKIGVYRQDMRTPLNSLLDITGTYTAKASALGYPCIYHYYIVLYLDNLYLDNLEKAYKIERKHHGIYATQISEVDELVAQHTTNMSVLQFFTTVGDYDIETNNCQHFVNILLRANYFPGIEVQCIRCLIGKDIIPRTATAIATAFYDFKSAINASRAPGATQSTLDAYFAKNDFGKFW